MSKTTTNTPANVAAIAGQSRAKGDDARTSPVTPVAAPVRADASLDAATLAPAAPLTVEAANALITETPATVAFTVEGFRSAIEAADATGSYAGAAADTLKAATLARYAFHAARFVHDVDGVEVVLSGDRSAVSEKVWQDAGFSKAPESKARTSALKSLGQYVAGMGTVATDLAYGTDHLASVAEYTTAIEEIRAFGADAKKAAADKAFQSWMLSLIASLDGEHVAQGRAISDMLNLFGSAAPDSEADTHRAAFVRAITPAKAAK